jgi:hypothetical protein
VHTDARNHLQAVSLEKKFELFGEYVRTVLSLSTGALVLSVTFLHDVIGLGAEKAHAVPVHARCLLAASWGGFLLSVSGCLLYLYFLALWANENRDCTKQLVAGNVAGLGGFLVGLFCLAVFSWLNVP